MRKQGMFIGDEDLDNSQDFSMEVHNKTTWTDDLVIDPMLQKHIEVLYETITRVGGEVAKLRAEMDGINEQSEVLKQTFDKLREVLVEKGTLDLDEFDLACEVMDVNTMPLSNSMIRKMAN